MTYPDFATHWQKSGGAERANYGLFLQDLCDLIGFIEPNPTTDNPQRNQYVLERAVTFNDGAKRSNGRIDLYKRGCFVLETKRGIDSPDSQQKAEKSDRAGLGLAVEKRRKGHALCPAYQAPDEQQAALAAQLFPTELAPQMQALRDALQQAAQPLRPAQVAARFRRVKAEKVEPVLATLAALNLVRQTTEGRYAT